MQQAGDQIVLEARNRLTTVFKNLKTKAPPTESSYKFNEEHFFAHDVATILDGLWKRLFEKDVAEQLHYNHTHFSRWLTDHIKNHCKIELDDHEAKYWFMKENMIEVNYDDLAAVPIMRETGLFTEQQFSELVLLESVLEMAACFNACTGCSRLQRRRELAVLQEALKVAETDEQLKEIEASINSLKTFYLSQGVVLEKTT